MSFFPLMKVHVIKELTLFRFVQQHASSKAGIDIWRNLVPIADWEQPLDIVATFGSADILGKGSNRVVFNLGGNKYRLICGYWFGRRRVHLYVKWIGTHAEYDKLCESGNQYTVDAFKGE
ncbi:MAG: type II toxin-antitoxin system HigB family toxin [Bacteroidota bacterium]